MGTQTSGSAPLLLLTLRPAAVQTGAVKTHTLSSMIACVEAALDAPSGAEVEVTFYEVATAGCCGIDAVQGGSRMEAHSERTAAVVVVAPGC